MKFLLDQDVYAATAHFLAGLGHDVGRAGELGLSHASDAEILTIAQTQNRILVTRDRDFGNLVFVQGLHAGVIYLRVRPATQIAVHSELENVMKTYSEDVLLKAFVVIQAGGHRIRRIRSKK